MSLRVSLQAGKGRCSSGVPTASVATRRVQAGSATRDEEREREKESGMGNVTSGMRQGGNGWEGGRRETDRRLDMDFTI